MTSNDFDEMVDYMMLMMTSWTECVLDTEPEVIQSVYRKLRDCPKDREATISFSAEEVGLLEAGFWAGTHFRCDYVAPVQSDKESFQADLARMGRSGEVVAGWEQHIRNLEDQPGKLAGLAVLITRLLHTAEAGELPHIALSLDLATFRGIWGAAICYLARRAAEGDERFKPSAN